MQIDLPDYIVTFEYTPEMHKAVFDTVLEYYKKHHSFHGEVIGQSDNCIIDAPDVLANIADTVIKFKVQYKDN